MKLSLKKALSLAIVSVMLFAVMAIPVSAAVEDEFGNIVLNDSNAYNWDSTKVVVWASDNEEAVIGDILGVEPFFGWFYKALLEYNEISKTFDVIATETATDATSDYTTWTLGYGRMIVMAHADCASATSLELLGMCEGMQFFLVGDYDAILAGGSVDGMYITINGVEPGGYWTKPIKPEYQYGLNIIPDENSNVLDDANIIAGLTDGDWVEGATSFATAGLYLVQDCHSNNSSIRPTISVVNYYEEATAVNTIKIGLYTEYASMIGLPENDIVISTSEDGENWTEVATVQHGLTLEGDVNDLANAEKGTKIATLTLAEAVTATYVKADLVYAASPFSDKPVWEFFCFTEVEFSFVEAEPEAPAAPDYSTKPIWVTHYNDETKEGAGVISTTGVTALAWRDHYAFAPVEGANNVFELVDVRNYLGTNVTPDGIDVPAGGFVYSLNTGNNYPALGMDGLDYTTTACNDAVALAATWTIGQKFYFYGVDLEGLTVPTSTPDVNWYEEGENEDGVYVCTATVTPYVKYDETETIGESGDASYGVAYGFTFPINYVNGSIVGEDVTLVDNADSYASCNPNWAISVQLTPVSGDYYEVVKVVPTPGSAAAAGIEWGEDDVVLVVHSASSNPNGGYANWQAKVVALALKAGDKVLVSETEAYVLTAADVIEEGGEDTTEKTVEELVVESMGEANAEGKFDVVVEGPASYVAGDEITVTATVKNIAEGGLTSVEFVLNYDATKLVLTTDLDEEDENALLCVTNVPNSKWENFSNVAHTVVDEVAVPDNDGIINVTAFTTAYAASAIATEDGDVSFTFTFTAVEDATGDIGVYVAHETVAGSLNTDTSIIKFVGNGSYIVIDGADEEEAPKTDLGKIEGADVEVGVYGEDSPVTNLNGDVFVFAAGAEDRVVTSDEANLRYSWILVVDADGKVVQIGNNLVKASEGKEGFQNDVTVPAGGFLVAFFYNADNNFNEELMNFYNELVAKYNEGEAIYNETIEVDSDYYLGVNAARDTLYITYGEAVGDGGEESNPEDIEPGDASNMIVFAILALVAIAGSAVVIKKR